MYLYETHMHTRESSACGVATAREQILEYKKRGYTGVIITDHLNKPNFRVGGLLRMKPTFTWEQKVVFFQRGWNIARDVGDEVGLDIFFGWEYRTREGLDILTYGLDPYFLWQHPKFLNMPIKKYSEFVKKYGGYIAQAHPYRYKRFVWNDKPADPKYLDGIEIFNSGRIGINSENGDAKRFAIENNLSIQGGTDSHHLDLPFYSGIIMEERAKTIEDIILALKNRSVGVIAQ